MKNIHYIFLLFIATLSLSSCASFSTKIIQDKTTKLTKENVQSIEGTYAIKSHKATFLSNNRKVISYTNLKRNSTIDVLTTKKMFDSLSIEKLVVDIKILKKNKITFIYRNQDSIVHKETVKLKIRGNGMLHLKNRHTHITGVPLIFGGVDISRSRIGLSTENELFINSVHYSQRTALVLFGDDRRLNQTFYFKKVQ
ncbi:hypothetical protein [uncultured Kordia sp.]|uniref:hypothetical protein n=1 Tax=uncultured Kordia sp. TaxID=507699 RepID=UPI002609AA06|nr:hypothetical protein [uncultured Kordia sp.]